MMRPSASNGRHSEGVKKRYFEQCYSFNLASSEKQRDVYKNGQRVYDVFETSGL